jgi:hypothetical protein
LAKTLKALPGMPPKPESGAVAACPKGQKPWRAANSEK